jgi:hypothetical protein
VLAVAKLLPEVDERLGELYSMPLDDGGYIRAQVARGGDLGVFCERFGDAREGEPESLAFRVHYFRDSPKRYRWVSLGKAPLFPGLSMLVTYGHKETGQDMFWAVRMDDQEHLISKSEYEQLPPMVTYGHDAILRRYLRECA